MTARDDLAALIGAEPWPSSWDRETHLAIADAILAAGWREPRPSPEACDNSDHGHEFYDTCAFCGVDAHDWYAR